MVYASHFALVGALLATSHTTSPSQKDIFSALHALSSLGTLSQHPHITLLTLLTRLRILVDAGMWAEVGQALGACERALGVSYASSPSSSSEPKTHTPTPMGKKRPREEHFISFENPLEASVAVQVLLIGIVFYTSRAGAADSAGAGVGAKEASERLAHLHALCDAGVLEEFGRGVVQVGYCLYIFFFRRVRAYQVLLICTRFPLFQTVFGIIDRGTAS